MDLKSMFSDFVSGLESDAGAVQKAMTGQLATDVVTHIPSLGPILKEIAAVAGDVTGYGEIASGLMALASIAKALGAKPMDPNEQAKEDEVFHYGDQTGG